MIGTAEFSDDEYHEKIDKPIAGNGRKGQGKGFSREVFDLQADNEESQSSFHLTARSPSEMLSRSKVSGERA